MSVTDEATPQLITKASRLLDNLHIEYSTVYFYTDTALQYNIGEGGGDRGNIGEGLAGGGGGWAQEEGNAGSKEQSEGIKGKEDRKNTVTRIVEPFHSTRCVTQDHNIYVVDFFDWNTPTFTVNFPTHKVDFSHAHSDFFRQIIYFPTKFICQ